MFTHDTVVEVGAFGRRAIVVPGRRMANRMAKDGWLGKGGGGLTGGVVVLLEDFPIVQA